MRVTLSTTNVKARVPLSGPMADSTLESGRLANSTALARTSVKTDNKEQVNGLTGTNKNGLMESKTNKEVLEKNYEFIFFL